MAFALSVVGLLASGTAFAQSSTVITTGEAPAAAVTIEPQYRTRIHTYVTEHHIAPVQMHEKIVVGATLPEDVELRPVPEDWGPTLHRYRYVYSNNHVVLVEPSSRKIVKVIE